MSLKGKSFRSNEENSSNILNGLYLRGDITIASDFPFPIDAKVRFVWEILTDVTDNDPTRTNTGDSFLEADLIMWDGGKWIILGNTEYNLKHHHTQHEIEGDDIVDIDGGTF